MKVVLDSNIFVSSFFWRGNPRKIFDRVMNGLDELYITDEILQEIAAVMSRKKFDIKINEIKDFIITGDDDLLVLKKYKNIRIVKPKEYLDIFI